MKKQKPAKSHVDLIPIIAIMLFTVLLLTLVGQALTNNTRQSMQDLASQVTDEVVPVMPTPDWKAGTGSIIELPSGKVGVLTNGHVCEAVQRSGLKAAIFVNGHAYQGIRVIKQSLIPDLCVYEVPALQDHVKLRVNPRNHYSLGERLYVLGFPRGGKQTPAAGYYIAPELAQIGRLLEEIPDCNSGHVELTARGAACIYDEPLHAMTTIIYPGNSGSPVLNMSGEIIGVVNAANDVTNQGYFISGRDVLDFLKGL